MLNLHYQYCRCVYASYESLTRAILWEEKIGKIYILACFKLGSVLMIKTIVLWEHRFNLFQWFLLMKLFKAQFSTEERLLSALLEPS